MEPRLNIITLGVRDLDKAVTFYRDGLGWPQSSASIGDFAIFMLSTGTALALYPRHLLAADAKVEDSGGFGGITLAQNVTDKQTVDVVLVQAVKAGGVLLKSACEAEWGGYSGYFAGPRRASLGGSMESIFCHRAGLSSVALGPRKELIPQRLGRILVRLQGASKSAYALYVSFDATPQTGQKTNKIGEFISSGVLNGCHASQHATSADSQGRAGFDK